MKVRRRFAKSEHAVISKIKNEIMNGQIDAIRKKYKLYRLCGKSKSNNS